MKTLEILFNKLIIKYIKWRFGARCKEEDFMEECLECQAKECISFLEYNIELTKI